MRPRVWRPLICAALAAALSTSAPVPASARSECAAPPRDDEGYRIRSVTVEGRWTPALDFPAGMYTNEKLSEAMTKVRQAIGKAGSLEFATLGSVSGIYVSPCITLVEPAMCQAELGAAQCLDIAIRPRSLRVDLLRLGDNVLPLPRSNRATFFSNVPRPLLAFNPLASVQVDRRYGVSQSFAFATDLLSAPRILAGEATGPGPFRLDLEGHERKAFDEPFYDAGGRLGFVLQRTAGLLKYAALDASYRSALEPQGSARLATETGRFGGLARLDPGWRELDALTLSLRGHWADSRRSGGGEATTDAAEAGLDATAIGEGRFWGGSGRFAAWFDNGLLLRHATAYERLGIMAAYAKEVPVALNQSIGLELVVGAGHAWGDVPRYARYFGGNTLRSFLYDSPTSDKLRSAPSGPLLRSFGENVLGGTTRRGGTRYWHANINLTLPIPQLSQPLIPDTEVGDALTLKEALKNAVGSQKSLYGAYLRPQEHLSTEESHRQADALWSRIGPAIQYLADQANLYAVKPLLMFDVAMIGPSDSGDRTLYAAGGGIQFAIVTARAEAGYMRTINPSRADDRGNFFFRLTFQNLF